MAKSLSPRVTRWAPLVAVAVAAAIAAIASIGGSSASQGPLVALIDGSVGIGQPIAVGKPMSVGGDIVRNTGDSTLVLDRVDLVGLQGVTYVGAYLVPFPLTTSPFTASPTYRVPPNGRVLPAAMPPHTKAWVVVGLVPTRGEHQWTSTDYIYHVGGATYRRHVAFSGAVCAPVTKYLEHCSPPGF